MPAELTTCAGAWLKLMVTVHPNSHITGAAGSKDTVILTLTIPKRSHLQKEKYICSFSRSFLLTKLNKISYRFYSSCYRGSTLVL
jgi:hypothetical protein